MKVGESPITRKNVYAFVGAMSMLFAASWWPLHDIGEQYLYSAHMLQHMMLSYFMPPLIWLATPEWLMRTIIGHGRFYHVVRWLTHPVVAGVTFNVAVWPPPLTAVISIRALFVNPAATFRMAWSKKPSPCSRSMEPATVVNVPLMLLELPRTSSTPWLIRGALIVV